MKNFHLISLIPSLIFIISPTYVSADLAFMTETCRKTPNFDLCMSILKADTRSLSADLAGLGIVVVDKISEKATAALPEIQNLLKTSQDPSVRKALEECAKSYELGILKADIPQATEALTKGDPKFAEQAVNDVALEADSCEKGFAKSHITALNREVGDISEVAAAIVKGLL